MTMKRNAGFTLVELLVVVAVIGAILVLAGPSLRDMILMQRLRGANAELVTDLQFARSEAVARRDFVRIVFSSDTTTNATCYTIYTAPNSATRCNCLAGPGSACSGGMVEIKTVKLQGSQGVMVAPLSTQQQAFAYDWRTGGILLIPTDDAPRPTSLYVIETYIDSARKLSTRLNAAGRPLVCTPSGSRMSESACP
jgi:type IV fimbrial biogenesis protein FimT